MPSSFLSWNVIRAIGYGSMFLVAAAIGNQFGLSPFLITTGIFGMIVAGIEALILHEAR